jgi:hypothetical protein
LPFQENICYLAADREGDGEGRGWGGGGGLTFTVFDLALCSDPTHFAIIIPYREYTVYFLLSYMTQQFFT